MIDTTDCFNDALYRLGVTNAGDLANSQGMTAAELFQYADDAVKTISYKSGVFVGFDSSITATAGIAVYNLPATHVYTLAAWLGAQPLRITPVGALWALDGAWSLTSGPSKRCSMDAGSVGTITLYPNPTVGGTVSQICQQFPSTVAQGTPTVPLPTVAKDYLTYAMLAGARGREWAAAQPEMAAHYQERMRLYEEVMRHLWGSGQ